MKIDNPKVTGELTLVGGGTSTLSGSFSGSFQGDGSQLTGIQSASFATTASFAVSASHEITLEVSSSYAESASFANTSTSSSFANTSTSSSFAQTASYAQNAEGSGFPFTGSAEITGSLTSNEVQATQRLNIPQGTTAERDTNPISGDLRYNTSTNRLEFYNGSIWVSFDGGEGILLLGVAESDVTSFFASAVNLTPPFTAWATTSSYPRTITQFGMSGDKDGALAFNGQDGGDGGLTYVASWNGSSWATTTSSPAAGHQLNLQHIGSKNDTMFTNRYNGSSFPGNTYQWNGSSWASTTSSPQSGAQMRSFGTTSDAIFHRTLGNSGTRQSYFYNGSSFSTTSTLPTDDTSVVFSGPDSSEGITAGSSISYVWNGSSWATTSAYSYNYGSGIGSSQGTNSVIGSSGSDAWPPANHGDSALWNGTTWATTSAMNEGRTYANGVGGEEGSVITTGGGYYSRRSSCEVTV